MTQGSAEQTIIVAACLCGGIWAYGNYQDGFANVDITREVTALGAVFLVLALIAMASPELAASFAALVVVAYFLQNGSSLIKQVTTAETSTVSTSAPKNPGGAKDVAAVHSQSIAGRQA